MTSDLSCNVVVLGAGGFLGGAVAEFLAKSGYRTLACSRKPLPTLAQLPNVTVACGDIRSEAFLCSVMQKADVVFHFASSTHPSLNFANPKAEFDEALAPLFDLIDVATAMKVKKVVFPSSGGTIYAEQTAPRTEATRTIPKTPYAICKLAAESLLLHAANQGKFSVDIFRIANPYGPGQQARPGQGVIPHWLNAIKKEEPLAIFGDGSACRDYVYIDDVCKLVSLSVKRLDESDIFNLGTGIATSLNELLELMRSVLVAPIVAQHKSSRVVDQSSVSLASNKLLRLVPEFEFTTLVEGMVKTLQSMGFSKSTLVSQETTAL